MKIRYFADKNCKKYIKRKQVFYREDIRSNAQNGIAELKYDPPGVYFADFSLSESFSSDSRSYQASGFLPEICPSLTLQ